MQPIGSNAYTFYDGVGVLLKDETMAQISKEDLKKYAESLPAVYRAILLSFPALGRKNAGPDQSLAVQTIAEHLKSNVYIYSLEKAYGLAEVLWACKQLTAENLLSTNNDGIFFIPTSLGWDLISAVDDHRLEKTMPKLPKLLVG